METLELGIYVRDEKGNIGKIINQKNDLLEIDNNLITYGTFHPEIIKASHNIIDLIEVGDIIKYKELRTHITNNCNTEYYEDYVCDIHSKEELAKIIEEIKGNHIKLLGIATKEQFKNNFYKMGE